MRRAPLSRLLLAIVASAVVAAAAHAIASADSSAANDPITEIRLGEAPPPPPGVDPREIHAVERFLASRQEGSVARAKGHAAGAPGAPHGASAEDLYGPPATRLIAYDFEDEAIESAGAGRFSVPVYLLFVDDVGQVVASRDEVLVFAGGENGWACESRRTTAEIDWNSDGVVDAAESLGISEPLREARNRLRDEAAARSRGFAYSVADIARRGDGRIVVQCLRFSVEPGRRGFDLNTDPLVFASQGGVLRIETN